MIFAKIALGLLGLGIVVFVHELGHFLAARLVGINVEAFSIGWGKPILKKKVGNVEYRLGMFPVGGYCKMSGDQEFKEAWEKNANGTEPEKGTFYGVSPWRRIVTCFAGPFFNLIFAVLVLSVIWGIGFQVPAMDNQIVLASEYADRTFPADAAGIKTGDRIIEINGKKTGYYHEIQENIIINAEKTLPVVVDRQGEIITLRVRPELDKSTGAGLVGIFPWADTVIADVVPGSDAAIAGLSGGDLITRVNGEAVANTLGFMKALEKSPAITVIDYIREGTEHTAEIVLTEAAGGVGINWPMIQYRSPPLSAPAALVKGAQESWKTLTVSLKSLALLFKGIELTKAVSGPIRITYMMGEAAAEGFGQSFGTGLRSLANFLALISIALCVMNLLPLPIIDGGLIIMFIIEMIRRKPLHPKTVQAFQTVGVALIGALMIFALFGDILYLARR
jgi:regulator of sigma E protease